MIWDNPSQLATQHSEVQILLIIPSFYGESRGWLIDWSAIAGQILWMQMPRWSFAYEMAVRDKHCERKELKQDWAEGEVKMQCRPHKAGREFWSKNCLIVLPSNCNGPVFITTLPHTHISHNHQWCSVLVGHDLSWGWPWKSWQLQAIFYCIPHSWAARPSWKGRWSSTRN